MSTVDQFGDPHLVTHLQQRTDDDDVGALSSELLHQLIEMGRVDRVGVTCQQHVGTGCHGCRNAFGELLGGSN
jgi:hypothetical protein